ncbi:hypothetical protein ETB97_007641 [Aspergillus alliaceus]|uniref:Nephrocystin 3-like N-terminal domain-containing protein n=1 Tax=Petromyces alliaceus TaxID=209559 RepID=A0A8H6E1V4_PETAA|nr:hypothetical protein ETB97_007641 [Aspergillus burnettii]
MRSLTSHRPKRKSSAVLSTSRLEFKTPREAEPVEISQELAVHADTDEESSPEERDEIAPEDITIVIFCALAYEAVAVRYSLDGEYTCRSKGNDYVYSFGQIADHKVVIAQSQMGTIEAAYCASAYDFGKYEQDNFQLKGCLNKPPRILISSDGALSQEELMNEHPLKKILHQITAANPIFKRPDTDDVLYNEDFHHVNSGFDCSGCEAASERKVILRPPRWDHQPVIHRGLILSGNGVVKSSCDRARLQQDIKGAICFEMEAAGIMDQMPCLVVRGICDYADSHKQDNWHYYAAAVAAAYCRALLLKVNSQDVGGMPSMKELVKDIRELADGVSELRNSQRATQECVQKIDRRILMESLRPIEEASFDSHMNEGDGPCLPGTRQELLSEIDVWAKSLSAKCIFWLEGMAGTGKSTISRTVSASLQAHGTLAASFFFRRGAGDQADAKRLFSTIAWQLAMTFPGLASIIRQTIEKYPNIAAKPIGQQFDKLLLQPLRDLKQSIHQQRCLVIVIDALDECDEDKHIMDILQLLPKVKGCQSINLRFFLTSRPELPSFYGSRQIPEDDRQELILHKIPEQVVARDIALFLNHKFARIRKNRRLGEEWPGKDKIETLTQVAIPLFILAATICRFLGDLKWSPTVRLNEFLRDPAIRSASEMNRTYLPILNQLLTNPNEVDSNKLREEFHGIIGVIILLATPLSVNALATLIDRKEEIILARVESFRSVLSVPDDPSFPIRTLHQSFRDFLLNTTSLYRIDKTATHRKIGFCCLRIMQTRLKRNICNLSSYGSERMGVDSKQIAQSLSPELQYACRYWVYHLNHAKLYEWESVVFPFLRANFLHWLEAMGLMGLGSETVGTINSLRSGLKS